VPPHAIIGVLNRDRGPRLSGLRVDRRQVPCRAVETVVRHPKRLQLPRGNDMLRAGANRKAIDDLSDSGSITKHCSIGGSERRYATLRRSRSD